MPRKLIIEDPEELERLSKISGLAEYGRYQLESFRDLFRKVDFNKLPAVTQEQIVNNPEIMDKIAESMLAPVGGQIKAFHGSPHKFTKFSMSKVGSGEGNQAFGYGLYFSEKPGVAKTYMRGREPKIGFDYDFDVRGYYPIKEKGNFFPNEADVKRYIKDKNESLYNVTLHKGKKPSEYDYLRWDKDISKEQGNKILKQLRKEKIDSPTIERMVENKYPGFDMYNTLSDLLESTSKKPTEPGKLASEFLLRAGIDGIKYPSGTLSGVKGSKSFNYVVFDEGAITIE